ncbi:SDR family NAD(P)-dependent oxidoreductase [Bacillus hwajinpoensis]|uniref:SDR family NAD(P)-dependent oxidoreductase n=1 Tax=Guptibacillus hwajinpoensis TaxID=208199 RepID=A0A845F332_9BACL|nr:MULTISPECIES: SDR family oxidoreductase [Bacillaceae]MYL65085.1 SDR family NAD(P)-dependent oxidoreductase [Pseudalkalibacillus hwajinpoensis]
MAKEKVVIITGASSGIGEETAKLLSDKGAKLVLAARREDRLKELKKKIEDNGGEAIYQVTDVTSSEEMESLAQYAYDTFGKIDVIVNNAGLMPLSLLHKKKYDEWDKMIDVNIKGVLYGIGAVLPYMREKKEGHVINISSVAGHEISPGSSVYSATKFAVRAITEGLRMEESVGNNIRATIISPGAVSTELTETITDDDVKSSIDAVYSGAIKADSIARTIVFAIEEPAEVAINEILVRPTNQEW